MWVFLKLFLNVLVWLYVFYFTKLSQHYKNVKHQKLLSLWLENVYEHFLITFLQQDYVMKTLSG